MSVWIAVAVAVLFVAERALRWYAGRRVAQLDRRIKDLEARAAAAAAGTSGAATALDPTALDPTAFGLPARADLDTGRGAPPTSASRAADRARAAARSGDWTPWAAHLAGAGTDWNERHLRIEALARHAVEDDTWLRNWLRRQPDSPDAAVVHAATLATRIGALRAIQPERRLHQEELRTLRLLLDEALPACTRAATLAPDDPSPWAWRLEVALGRSRTEFDAILRKAVDRAPHHYGAHRSAFRHRTPMPTEPVEPMIAFVERIAATAPPESLLSGLVLEALLAVDARQQDFAAWTTPAARRAVDRVLADLGTVPADDPRAAELRHLVAYGLTHDGRYAEAVEQFRLIGRHVGSPPWSWASDPAAWFGTVRNRALAGWDAAGRPAPPEPPGPRSAVGAG
ncbi:hypothetical protein KNE206_74760 [Kitasatospora sp. NE20-6]|uniref:hypothetical protein n=1 Tax=Kitasatospora sp. NE20-6 TaxID=2859066 RepID=UPI0034DB9580